MSAEFTSKEDTLFIELEKGDKGFGFNIVGGTDTPHIVGDSGIFISTIKEDGSAFRDGRLKQNDRILSINGESVVNVPHQKAVECFKQAKGRVKLEVASSRGKSTRAGSAEPLQHAAVLRDATSAAEKPPSLKEAAALPAITIQEHDSTASSTKGKPNDAASTVGSSAPAAAILKEKSGSDLKEASSAASQPPQPRVTSTPIAPAANVTQPPKAESNVQRTDSVKSTTSSLNPSSQQNNVGYSVDSPRSVSPAPSTQSLIDDVPKTPKKQGGARGSGANRHPYQKEWLATAIGVVALVGIGYFVYKRFAHQK